jgi:hypothetical protein
MPPAALVADPAGDADVQAELEVGPQFFALAGEAVRDGVSYFVFFKYFGKSRMRISRVQKERLVQR